MVREIVFFETYFIQFYRRQNTKVKAKIQYVLELLKQVDKVPQKFLKSIAGVKGLYEIRIEYQSNIYRVFCCFGQGQLVVLFNGFQKKTQKTPKREIEKAKKLMELYFKQKVKGHG